MLICIYNFFVFIYILLHSATSICCYGHINKVLSGHSHTVSPYAVSCVGGLSDWYQEAGSRLDLSESVPRRLAELQSSIRL